MKAHKYTVALVASLAGASFAAAAPPLWVDSPSVTLPGTSHLAGWTNFQTNNIAATEVASGFSGTSITTVTGYGIGAEYGNSEGVYGANEDWYGDAQVPYGAPPPAVQQNGAVQLKTTESSFTVTNLTDTITPIDYLLFDLRKDNMPVNAFTPTVSVRYVSTGTGGSNTIDGGITGLKTSPDFGDRTFDLSSYGISIGQTQSITFFFKLIGAGDALLDNVGIASIPEPGSLLAFGCFLGSGLLIRRNRRTLA